MTPEPGSVPTGPDGVRPDGPRKATARPPLGVVVRYRLLGRRPDTRYDEWLHADLDSRWYPLHGVPGTLAAVALTYGCWAVGAALGWWSPLDPVLAVALALVITVAGVVRAAIGRDATRDRLFGGVWEIGHFQPYRHLERDE